MPDKTPRHIAFIMDGNGRWATRRGLPRLKGHAAGVETVRTLCDVALNLGIPYITLYAFSSENWKRPEEEVSGLFTLMRLYFYKEMKILKEKHIRVRFAGDRSPSSKLSPDILKLMDDVEAETRSHTRLTVTFAINYGGRDEILRAVRRLVAEGQPVTEETFADALDTAGVPDPDLIIRTGGDQRLSNFLLWQSSYAELYFSPLSWPDFDAAALQEALASFGGRQRRFGGLIHETEPAATA